ncbi:MAG: hypothetical protein WBI13_04625, partial [Synechococcus sp.]
QTLLKNGAPVVSGDDDADEHPRETEALRIQPKAIKKRGVSPSLNTNDAGSRQSDQSAAPPLFAVPVTPLPAPSPRPSLRSLRFLNLRA